MMRATIDGRAGGDQAIDGLGEVMGAMTRRWRAGDDGRWGEGEGDGRASQAEVGDLRAQAMAGG